MTYCTPYCPPSECPTKPKGKCVLYGGIYLSTINVTAGEDLDTILGKINDAIETGAIDIETQNTPSIQLVGNGTNSTPLAANLILNPSPSNVAQMTAQGLLVEPIGFTAQFNNSYFNI